MVSQKPLSFTKHASDAAFERKLDRSWIEKAVREPDWILPDLQWPGVERRFRAIPEFSERILRVACLENDDEIRILTAFFDRNARDPR